MGDLIFIGDVHLDRDDPALPDFLAFLDRLRETASRIVLLGDLFNLWIGGRTWEAEHQRAVLERFRALRRAGVVVRYVEGNRDYRIGRAYAGDALDDASGRGLVETTASGSLFAIHGDLANRGDRRYRTWRALSRSRVAWLAFHALPRQRRGRLAAGLERRLRSTNLEYKRAFPEREVREYAARWLARGHRVVVLGHFHVERDLEARPPSPPGRVLVLPEWRSSRRHLRVSPDGVPAFVDSAGA